MNDYLGEGRGGVGKHISRNYAIRVIVRFPASLRKSPPIFRAMDVPNQAGRLRLEERVLVWLLWTAGVDLVRVQRMNVGAT